MFSVGDLALVSAGGGSSTVPAASLVPPCGGTCPYPGGGDTPQALPPVSQHADLPHPSIHVVYMCSFIGTRCLGACFCLVVGLCGLWQSCGSCCVCGYGCVCVVDKCVGRGVRGCGCEEQIGTRAHP